MKRIFDVFYKVVLVFLVLVAGLTALSVLGLPSSLRFFVVQSGSMEPAIKLGSLAVISPSSDYKEGDIITFKANSNANIKNPNLTITHRIVGVEESNGSTFYQTKGDANNAPDLEKRSKDLVLGKVIFSIPYLGYPVGFAKTQTGFVLLIVIPATIIVYSELLSIRTEMQKLLSQRKKRKLTMEEKVKVAIGEEELAVEKGVIGFLRKLKR